MSLERESSAPTRAALKRTALNGLHKSLGAKMVEFGGWEMPVEYSGIIQEHLAVRNTAGLFDVSHMGEIEISGPHALSLLQHITSNDASRLRDFQAQYSALMHPKGSCVDDCVVHRLTHDQFLICVNAANTDKDLDWIVEHNSVGAEVRDVSSDYSQLALQGPRAAVNRLQSKRTSNFRGSSIIGSAAPGSAVWRASWRAPVIPAKMDLNSISRQATPSGCGAR